MLRMRQQYQRRYVKDPSDVLDYVLDWDDHWLSTGETITSAVSSVYPTGLTINSQTHDNTTTTVWLSGGTLNEAYSVTTRITTNQGRTKDRSVRIDILHQ